MATGFENQGLIDKLPKEGVHCYPANEGQIKNRRIITVILMVAFAALAVVFLVMQNKYRVAVDYNEKKLVLRYRFSLIEIPFDCLDSRDGEADQAEQMLENATGKADATQYLVLDNVFDEACYQTSTRDLASKEDFDQLKSEAFAIADAYGARNAEGAIKPNTDPKHNKDIGPTDLKDVDIDAIVDEVTEEHKAGK